jgi:hypothetical protein
VYEPVKKNKIHPEEELTVEEMTDTLRSPSEDALFDASWHELKEAGDPYYNVNFARDGELFSLD